ncbi:heparinase II/III family protein [Roseomonas sp. CAU 1739]|uniref:heparinase II/III domain-containing protein n=1 Tax=Roseomonas sp. CAU 1739 TaxID=3140364 RepID=UPI00325AF9E8
MTPVEAAPPAALGSGGLARRLLLADAAWRLGPRACALMAWHRLRLHSGIVARALADAALPAGQLLPPHGPSGGMSGDAAALAGAAESAVAPGWHGPFPAGAHALGLDLFVPGDIRPVWEANRLLALPLLAMAARLAPDDGHLPRAEALLRGWADANPAYRGPAWACGQEAALRAMHLCLALALLEFDRAPTPSMRRLLSLHARRIDATRAYAAAQDNNHAVSEPAALFVIGLVLGDAALARRGARGLADAVARLVAPDGAFAQASPGYHRLLLDTLVVAEWFRRRHGEPAFAAPFRGRAAAATHWLHRVMDPLTGALPRCGAVDDSAFADLSLHGADDARGSVGRAMQLFGTAPDACGAGWPGTAEGALPPPDHPHQRPAGLWNADFWLRGQMARGGARDALAGDASGRGLDPVGRRVPGDERAWGGKRGHDLSGASDTWHTEGWMGGRSQRLRFLLRTGAPLRFRPAQADLLHLDLTLDGAPLLIDGGTGAYNPPPGCAWWTAALAGTAGHNTVQFDDEDQMPRVGRFLFARWPRCRPVPDGAALRDSCGRRHERHIRVTNDGAFVEDHVAGPFARLALRWRLAPGEWHVTADGAEGPRARLRLSADAPCRIRLVRGWQSPAYGRVEPAPVLELTATAPVTRLTTLVEAS